ncbi:MAG: phosphatase PAP2 family protein [Planctomycetota bacterium]
MNKKLLRPVDILNLSFFIFLFLLSVICMFRSTSAFPAVLYYADLVLLLILIFWGVQKYNTKFLRIAYAWHPLFYLFTVFGGFAYLLPVLNKQILDYLFIKIDRYIFGVDPTVWLERFQTTLFTDVMHIVYAFYFFMPFILLIVLYIQGKYKENREAVFIMLAGAYICYIGYFIFPAIGPRFTIDFLQTKPIGGSAITFVIRRVIEILEPNNRDIFPSAHIALSMTMTYVAWKFHRFFFWIYLVATLLTFLTTVYCRYHYVIDLAGGVVFGIIIIVVTPRLYHWLLKRQESDIIIGVPDKET